VERSSDNSLDLLVYVVNRYGSDVAKVGGFAIPGFVITMIWFVVIILFIILLAYIVHRLGGASFTFKVGHFNLQIGVN